MRAVRSSCAPAAANYIADAATWTDWRASPLLAPDLSRRPSALVLAAGFDPLRDEGLECAGALSRAGNAVQYVCFERPVHGFFALAAVIDEAWSASALAAAALQRVLG